MEICSITDGPGYVVETLACLKKGLTNITKENYSCSVFCFKSENICFRLQFNMFLTSRENSIESDFERVANSIDGKWDSAPFGDDHSRLTSIIKQG